MAKEEEIHVDDEPYDRRKAYELKMKANGYRRVSIWVPAEERALVLELREILSEGYNDPDPVEELRDHLCSIYEYMLRSNELQPGDHAYAKDKIRGLREVPMQRKRREQYEANNEQG